MVHPFEVGKTYRNRKGEYSVIRIDGPQMVIRYTDGSELQTAVDVQERIWSNIQAEARLERETKRAESQPRMKRRGGRRGLDFQGLQDHDFQEGVTGTSWRASISLGGRLAQHMTDTTGRYFHSYPIYGRPEVHIAQPERYNAAKKLPKAKFIFALAPTHAWYGFYIEKDSNPMDSTWHWPNMIAALSSNVKLQQEIEKAMDEHNLRWQVYVWGKGGLLATTTAAPEGLLWQQQGIGQEVTSWSDFTGRVSSIEQWVDLFLITRLSKEQALSAGTGVADPVVAVYRAMLLLYDASTGRVAQSR
jgi:hypothetical protein